jgi:hypothetical protein
VDQERHPSAVDELKQHNLNVLNIDQMGEFLWARDQQKNENTVSYSILLEQKKNFLEERERKLLEDSVVYYSISKESDSSEITRNITNSLFMNPSLISRYPNVDI